MATPVTSGLSSGGGSRLADGPSASRASRTAFTSSARRRTVTASARATHASALARSRTGSSVNARAQESVPFAYARANSSERDVARSSFASAHALRVEMPRRSRTYASNDAKPKLR